MWEWGRGLAGLVDSAELIVSELITNAVAASRPLPKDPPVRLWLTSDLARVLVLVGDRSTRPPLRLTPGVEAEKGRGLLLVEAASDRWGWHATTAGDLAKVVWAELSITEPDANSGDVSGSGGRAQVSWRAGT